MELQVIHDKIYTIRNQKILLDFDLAELYQVETRVLKQAVRRNLKRFPSDFMFSLSKNEWNELITNCDNLPKNIKFSIIRAFVQLRQFALTHSELNQKLKEIENKYDKQFENVYEVLNYLVRKDKQITTQEQRIKIGYK